MIFPDNFEEKTGFSQIRNMIAQECLCSLGRKSVEKIKFQTDYKVIKHLLEQTEEFRQILLTENQFPSSNYIDASQTLLKISIEGTWAEASDIYELYQSLETIKAILDFFERKDESGAYPHLCQMASIQSIDEEIFYQIEKTINNQGEIKDTASTELQDIRKEIRQKHNMISRNLNHLLNQAKSQGLIASDAELNFRNGRLVIPVPASNKRKIKGYIHDESATGQTVYIEPEEIFEANNEIRELELAERREIIKILIQLCQVIRPHIQELDSVFRFLGIIDCIRAKAKVALKMEAFKPMLQAKPVFKWIKTRHPLLFLAHKAQNKSVVPLDLELDGNQRILVISGPNAGGKSVCLKTAGLVQYMIQCGLLVPMIEYSEAGVFENIFIDIGDQQSLENDLSTYSSHLLNMNTFLK
ncbi:MAG: endonuclease MutS2, partial [Bacteroidales bacterium]|nr:endonuclease MutS2 [Bacteroidales bacterium]